VTHAVQPPDTPPLRAPRSGTHRRWSAARLWAWLKRGRRPLVVGLVALAAIAAGASFGAILPKPPATSQATEPTAGSDRASISASPSATESAEATRPADPTSPASTSPSPVETASASAAPAPADTPVPTATAEPTPIPTLPPGDVGVIAFHRSGDIWAIDADGSGLTNLTSTSDVEETNPVWSADGDLIAFQSNANGGGVEVMHADGSARRRVADGFPRNAGYFTDSLAWAPGGHRLAIAFVSGEVAVVDVASGDRWDVGFGERWLSWSSTGRYLAWANGGTILAWDSVAGSVVAVTAMETNVRWINWFPAEDRLLFLGFGATGNTDLYTVVMDGSAPAPLAETPDAYEDNAQLSPDGRRILFSREYAWPDQAEDDLAMMDVDGSEPTTVLAVPGQGLARWSPSGMRAVAERDGQIYVFGNGVTDPVEIAAGYAPVWQPTR
jgi:WD40-like Beta Propeller Repeat